MTAAMDNLQPVDNAVLVAAIRDLRDHNAKLVGVLDAAKALVEAVKRGDETCVCGFGVDPATDTGHGRGCPVRKLGRAVAKASR